MITTGVYVGLGSNLAHPPSQLQTALQALTQLPKSWLIQCSDFYRSRSLLPGQPDYCNAVAELATSLSAAELLQYLQTIEQQQGRVRQQVWGPRTLDLDLLLYGQTIIATSTLTVPHPGLTQRNFVLYPLAQIAPDLVLPNKMSLTEILANLSEDPLDFW